MKNTYLPFRLAPLLGLLFISCAAPQEFRLVRSWDPNTNVIHAVAMTADLLVVRQTPLRTEIDQIDINGALKNKWFTDRPVTLIAARGDEIAWIEEVGQGVSVVRRIRGENVVTVSNEANWTDLTITRDGEVIAFESLFLSRFTRPSAVRIRNLDRDAILLNDQFSYHGPIGRAERFILSPIDRRIRRLHAAGAEEIGEVTSLDAPPIATVDGERIVWFGPHIMGSALYIADMTGPARVLRNLSTIQPHAWIGPDLLLADRNDLTGRWTLSIISVPDGLIKRTVPVPANVTPRTIVASPDGRHIGLPLENGSMLLRIEDGFLQEFREMPLSMWRFAENGKILFLATQRDVRAVDLR